MGIFSKKKAVDKINWINVDSVEKLQEFFNQTSEKQGLFFKHSTRCGISSMALNRFEKEWEETDDCTLYFIDLLAHRDVSNALAEITGIVHQSPQAILVKNKTVIYDATHSGISASQIKNLL
ncbi:MAG TPA: bacillithiol system redox-active protein YtxJ [Brumimicrobium sp.]|nr:bacillithiol system redox-active protein YtxJ [Brumimicrobium sp.]